MRGQLISLFPNNKDMMTIDYSDRANHKRSFACELDDSWGIDEITAIIRYCNSYNLSYHLYVVGKDRLN